MKFCTVINCMDGRVQQPVNRFLQERFGAENVDTITEAGPNGILAKQEDEAIIQSIFKRVDISVNAHKSKGMAIVGHHDCAGNPAPKEEQIRHIRDSVSFLQKHYQNAEIIGLWVDENWEVSEV
ncbi:MAG: hypothetical protein K9J27_05130 [Bacteroidales bacterium]|nr:hypothetical protein [Bacteroidales bacterium]MCF8333105.1 hypothetical protein [Bacteroidales bacterium]